MIEKYMIYFFNFIITLNYIVWIKNVSLSNQFH